MQGQFISVMTPDPLHDHRCLGRGAGGSKGLTAEETDLIIKCFKVIRINRYLKYCWLTLGMCSLGVMPHRHKCIMP